MNFDFIFSAACRKRDWTAVKNIFEKCKVTLVTANILRQTGDRHRSPSLSKLTGTAFPAVHSDNTNQPNNRGYYYG